jgi:hypothetical protein
MVLMSLIGGLTISLRLIAQQIMNVVHYLLKSNRREQRRQGHAARVKLCDRVKKGIRSFFNRLISISINLNMFTRSAFHVSVDRITFERYGRWSTRLYAILLIASLTFIVLYTAVRPRILTHTYNSPSLTTYQNLLRTHSDTLRCPCSTISSRYDRFIKIQPVFHEVCYSRFASEEWHNNLTYNLISDLSSYALMDYRRIFSAHFQFLVGLCELSIRSVNASLARWLISDLVTVELLTPTALHTQLDALLLQRTSEAPAAFNQLLFLIRNTNHGNTIVSSYGTNYEYIPNSYDGQAHRTRGKAMIYDNNCSCAMNSTCTTQARLMISNTSEAISIKGLKMGCTPSESFLVSNLECLFDAQCISLIYRNMNHTSSIDIPLPLSRKMTRFSHNSTVEELISHLFVQDWPNMIHYTLYFEQCSPYLCSYTHIQKINSLQTVTLLLGLYGGLTIVFKWICPILVQLFFKLFKRTQNRVSIIDDTVPAQRVPNEFGSRRVVVCFIFSFLFTTTAVVIFIFFTRSAGQSALIQGTLILL